MGKFYKFSEDDVAENNLEEIECNLEPKVKLMLDKFLTEKKIRLICSMADCESPIERLMALALFEQVNCNYISMKLEKLNLDVVEIDNQYVLNIDKKQYITDFAVMVWNRLTHEGNRFIVECDGHDFHEKTVEQVRKDKERERNIIKDGNILIRFSGSEIYNDSEKCASEVFQIIFNHFKK